MGTTWAAFSIVNHIFTSLDAAGADMLDSGWCILILVLFHIALKWGHA